MNVSPWLKKHTKGRVFRTLNEAVGALRAYRLAHPGSAWRPIYLGGPINGCSDAECRGWRAAAKSALGKAATLDPMARDYRGIEDGNEDAIVEGDLADIRACSAILAYTARPSWGTAMEIRAAFAELNVPVFAFMEVA